ncbi:hypothetical protein X943_001329 [Babesia divergens]|uniref:COG complex component COG2 C-terminal domain-containing protein n=1 Tax=Babesia divergens TaxID=32595 RepID=A0AAD9LGJ8_BABDI|nr:hypothetical protein X943_001329 [Babesia divergens]
MAQRGRTASLDIAMDSGLYNETLEQLNSINIQVKSPGDYVASRLESVDINDIRRELKALLASCESHASELLKSLFSNARPFNETMESTINSIAPFKDMLENSMKALEGCRNALKSTHREVEAYLCRYAMVLYTKIALSTYMDANNHLDNIAEEIVDSFKVYCNANCIKRGASSVDSAVAMIEDISKSVLRQEEILRSTKGKYNLVTNWSLIELVPKEINSVKALLLQCRNYECTIAQYLDEYSAMLQRDDPELRKPQLQILNDTKESNVEQVLKIEKVLEWNDVEQFHVEYTLEGISARTSKLQSSLISLTEICTHAAMKTLFELYTERSKMVEDTQSDATIIESITKEIETYVAGLSSLLKGGELLYRQSFEDNNQMKNKMPFVASFSKTFVKPICNTHVSVIFQREGGFLTLSPHEEFSMFTKFVDLAILNLLHPKRSITMQMLNDVSNACGNDKFKIACLFDAIGVELLNNVEKNFSSIYFPIYMEQFMQNYQAYEHLLERIELAAGNYQHYLRWRGSTGPINTSKCFGVGVVCDNFIEEITSKLRSDISAKQNISGAVFTSTNGKAFYASPSHVLCDMVYALFNHRNFFYHLMPQYLRGVSEMFTEYIKYIKLLLAKMDTANNIEDGDTDPSAGSVTHAAYILHDLDLIVNFVWTGTTRDLEIGLKTRPLRACVSDYGNTLIDTDSETAAESSTSYADISSSSTSSGSTSSTNVSGLQSPTIGHPRDDLSSQGPVPYHDNAASEYEDIYSVVVSMHSKCDGDIVKIAVKRLEYPLQVAFKRIAHIIVKGQRDQGNKPLAESAAQILDAYWKHALNVDMSSRQLGVNSSCCDFSTVVGQIIPQAESDDLRKLVNFAKASIDKMYDFFCSIHEQLDAMKYILEDFVIQNLVTSASCSLQFLQSMPSKFRMGNQQDVNNPSNYVKYLVVPLTSFNDFTASTLSREMRCKIMTQTISRLAAEYRSQVIKLIQTVQNLNQSLLNSKNQRIKEQGANFLIADIDMIKQQLSTDITEYVKQCETRLEVSHAQCEDLRRLMRCINDELKT